VSFLSGNGGTATLESLQQASEVSSGMRSNEQVHVGSYHADLENPRIFLCRHGTEELAEEPCQPGVDQWLAIARGPDDVAIDAIDHRGESGLGTSDCGIVFLRARADSSRDAH